MTEILLLCGALIAQSVWIYVSFRNIRRDILKVAKNPRAARNDLLQKRAYKSLD